MKVENLKNNNGNIVKNQFIITNGTTVVFQSYETLICEVHFGSALIKINKNAFNYSMTTTKHFLNFLYSTFNYNKKWNRKNIEKWMQEGISEIIPMYKQNFDIELF